MHNTLCGTPEWIQGSPGVVKEEHPYPWYCATGRTELKEIRRTGMNVLHNSQKFRVRA